MRQAVIQYDLSGSTGFAIYAPGRTTPRFDVIKMPKPRSDGGYGPPFKHLFDHVAWADRNFGLAHIGYEAFLAPTGGATDKGKGFVTSPKTLKALAGYMAVLTLAAEIIGAQLHEVNQASWRKFWLPGTKRGTDRAVWKRLAQERAVDLGFVVAGDDDADAIGQLHYLLDRLHIIPPWKTDRGNLLEIHRPEGPMNV